MSALCVIDALRESAGAGLICSYRMATAKRITDVPRKAKRTLEILNAAQHERDARILRESIQEFPGPVAVYDENDRLIACNEHYRWVHGAAFETVERRAAGNPIDYADLIRESARLVVPPEDMEAHVADRIRAQRDGVGEPKDRYYPDRGWFRIVKIRTPSGAVAGFATNVTELKETTLALEQARVAAESANVAKSAFLANMSHELRTPLNAIIGLSEALELGVFGPIENEQHKSYMADIRKSGHHLLALISDILDLAKVEAGTLEINCEVFEIDELVDECIQMLQTIAGRVVVHATTVSDGRKLRIFADRRKIKQALINILSNAVKYSHEAGTVRVSRRLDDEGLYLDVQDEGVGIEKDEIGRVFQPFDRLSQALASAVEGAGLGLPIALRFVELHGGEIKIDSDIGRGTRVEIKLPLSVIR